MAEITSDLAQKIRRLSGGCPDDFRRDNIAGSHGILKVRILIIQKGFQPTVDYSNSVFEM